MGSWAGNMNPDNATTAVRANSSGAKARPAVGRSAGPRFSHGEVGEKHSGYHGRSWQDGSGVLFALRAGPDDLVFEAVNAACARSLQVDAASVRGRSPMDVLPADAGAPFLVGCLQCVASGKVMRFTHAMVLETRNRRWDTTLTPVCDDDGVVIRILGRSRELAGPPEPGRQCARQISDVAGQAALAPTSFLDLGGGDAVEMALLDARGLIVSVNAAWRATFAGLEASGRPLGVETPYEIVCRQVIPGIETDVLREAMRQLLAREVHTLTHAYTTLTPDGPRWRQIRITPLRAGVAHFIAVHENHSEIAVAREQRRTSQQLLTVQQEERERIAIELHDSTGIRLAALGLGVSELRRLIGPRAKAQDILDDMAVSLDEAVKEIRVMSRLMHPSSLHRDGLEATARAYVKGFGSRTRLNTMFRSEGPVDLANAAIRHSVVRVIQEALSNVHRHAHAKGVEVELASRGGELTLRIADDGRGIAPLRRAHLEGIPPGVGIAGMRSRVEELNGSFGIASDAAGTVVTVRIPVAGLALPMAAARPAGGVGETAALAP